jgi:hypothetical protein
MYYLSRYIIIIFFIHSSWITKTTAAAVKAKGTAANFMIFEKINSIYKE